MIPEQGPPAAYNGLEGDKSTFRKLTLTVPADLYERLVNESARRKISGEPNRLLSGILREALAEYLERRQIGK
jgi:hypothetical protein